ncbi:MFS transporter [Variovorax sp. GrIS 2.14]|uniref:MFS transporter n=1 Tax=Variovorax sp. GrIS 2.14 TaxID=3071709 RepID=UPI0038F7F170
MSHPPVFEDATAFLKRGTPAYRRATCAIFCAGLSTFASIYCVQPLLPLFASHFGVSAANSSLTLSLTTLCLALCMLVAGSLAEALGRKPVMMVALGVSGVLGLACAFVDSWPLLLVLRALVGVALSGLPALAMAYVGEEFDPSSLSSAMGLYISGNVLGGLAGRLLSGGLADLGGWPLAMGGIATLSLASLVIFAWLLPPSRHFRPQPLSLRGLTGNFATHLKTPALRTAFALAFLLMGSFVAVFNYIGFRLALPPFGLSSTVIGLLFTVYLLGSYSASKAGSMVDRIGARRVVQIGIGLMLLGIGALATPWLPVVVFGLALLTGGFFAAHAVASGQIGQRAHSAKAQAASLYLCAYYLGSGVLGYAGGALWQHAGWVALMAGVAISVLIAAALTRRW